MVSSKGPWAVECRPRRGVRPGLPIPPAKGGAPDRSGIRVLPSTVRGWTLPGKGR